MLNWLITGGCGFIGVNLVKHIFKSSVSSKIRVVDNLSTGNKDEFLSISSSNYKNKNGLMNTKKTNCELIVGDVRDKELAFSITKDIDIVVHLAAMTGVIPSVKNPDTDYDINVGGTFNYLEACRKNKVKKFIFASSGAALGEQKPPIHENIVPRPISPYGASKLCGEAYCSAFWGSFGIETVVFRFGNVYGPYSSHKSSVVANFIKHILLKEPMTIYGDGMQTRDFIFVDDIVNAIIRATKQNKIGGEVFQIATHKEHTVRDIAEKLNNLAEKQLCRRSAINYRKERKGEARQNYSDISKAKNRLDFKPLYKLDDGLEKTFNWFIENNVLS